MSAAARERYDRLPPLTEEELRLAKCPVVRRDGKLIIIDEKRGLEIPLRGEKNG